LLFLVILSFDSISYNVPGIFSHITAAKVKRMIPKEKSKPQKAG